MGCEMWFRTGSSSGFLGDDITGGKFLCFLISVSSAFCGQA
jgi:hypothetical protein